MEFRSVGFLWGKKNPRRNARTKNKFNPYGRRARESNPCHSGGRRALVRCANRAPQDNKCPVSSMVFDLRKWRGGEFESLCRPHEGKKVIWCSNTELLFKVCHRCISTGVRELQIALQHQHITAVVGSKTVVISGEFTPVLQSFLSLRNEYLKTFF